MNPLRKAARALDAATLVFLLIAISGCKSSPPPAEQQASSPAASSAVPQASAAGQSYDFYLLNLSWSPEYCHTHPGSPECAGHPGFVVHGLWPRNNDGSYPQNCPSRPGPTSDSVWQGLMPTAALAQHEWQTHGACTPYDADTYFGMIRKAFKEVQIPDDFTGPTQSKMEPPAVILGLFSGVNPSFPADSFALSCGNNDLTAIEVCLDKNLSSEACQGVHSCRANNVKIAPR